MDHDFVGRNRYNGSVTSPRVGNERIHICSRWSGPGAEIGAGPLQPVQPVKGPTTPGVMACDGDGRLSVVGEDPANSLS